MASLDLDHAFIRGIHLLHSTSKDSIEALKQLHDDAVALKLGIKEPRSSSSLKQDVFPPRRPSPKCASSEISNINKSKKYEDTARKNELGKRIEKAEPDVASEPKRIRIESPLVSPGQSPNPSRSQDSTPPPLLNSNEDKPSDEPDNLEGNTDADEFALKMGLVCVVCRQMDVSVGNQLIECQECHNLYHQECHKPPATDHDVNDPRLVWYCAKCKKNMKKIATVSKAQKPVSKTAASTVTTVKDSTLNKAFKSDSFSSLQLPFKRVETKASSNSSSSKKPVGLAGFAANLNNKASMSSSGSSSSKGSHKLSSNKSSSQSHSNNPIKGLASLALSLKPTKTASDKGDKSES